MKLGAGQEFKLINLATEETANFYIASFHEYNSQYICYGETKVHGIRVAKGAVLVPSRPGCFVVLPNERAKRIMEFVDLLNGLPLALVSGRDIIYIVNMRKLPGFWDSSIHDKDALLKHGAKIIDLYHEWRNKGYIIPQWFSDLKNKSKGGQN